jgi:hypothetical protein
MIRAAIAPQRRIILTALSRSAGKSRAATAIATSTQHPHQQHQAVRHSPQEINQVYKQLRSARGLSHTLREECEGCKRALHRSYEAAAANKQETPWYPSK